MFTWLNKQGVKSDQGFIVQSVDRFTIEYREGIKRMSVLVERGFLPNNKVCVCISPDAFVKWDDGMPISVERQKEILNNFTEAMEFQGMGVVVE